MADTSGEGDDCEILARALDLGLSELLRILAQISRIVDLVDAHRNNKVVLESCLTHWEGLAV